jgi:hypothetical protein
VAKEGVGKLTGENALQQADDFVDHNCDVFNKTIKGDIADLELTTELFSTCFIEANPSEVNCGQNDEKFRDASKQDVCFIKISRPDLDYAFNAFDIYLLNERQTKKKDFFRSK